MKRKPLFSMIALLLATVCIVSVMILPVCAVDESVSDVLTEAKQGVVQIYGLGYDRYNNPEATWVGSGFCVSNPEDENAVFVTNWHVATGDGEYDENHVQLWILQENCGIRDLDHQPDPSRSIECKIVTTTFGSPDFAILETTKPAADYKALPLLSSKEVEIGETVYALGYPSNVGAVSVSNSGIEDITVTNGIVSQRMQDSFDATWVLMHTALISGGNSGGPLITEQGAVVGVNTYTFADNRYFAIYTDYITNALEMEGIPYQVYGEGPGIPVLKIVIIAAIALAVLAAVVIAVVVIRKKRAKASAKKENADIEVTKADDAQHQNQVQMVTFRLKMPDGRIIPVNKTVMTIGRDPGCDICIAKENSNISRYHCKLEIIQGRLVVSDTASRNGTFIHGKQIPAGTRVALKSGSSFAMGQNDYVITVL